MSIELRWVIDGECVCGLVREADAPATCTHRLVTDWGEVVHGNPQPSRGEVGYLILTQAKWFHDLYHWGPTMHTDGRIYRATVTNGRRFVHLAYQGQRWTWEMFDAHWADGCTIPTLLGRWPD